MAVYADVLRYWDLFSDLFRRDFAVRYRGSVLGVAWTMINPLLLMLVYTILFSFLIKAQGIDSISSFPLFVLTGLLAWIFFQTSVSTATSSLVGNASLVKQVRFPRQLLPLSIVAANVFTLARDARRHPPASRSGSCPNTRTTFWASVFLLVPLVGFVGGLAIFVACANALFRDVELHRRRRSCCRGSCSRRSSGRSTRFPPCRTTGGSSTSSTGATR